MTADKISGTALRDRSLSSGEPANAEDAVTSDVTVKGERFTSGSWHVGAMNDCLFIINRPPSPAPYDGPIPGGRAGMVIAKLDYIGAGPNARLIAAAPDLMALAEAVAAHFDGTDAPLGVAARAVVAKARGE